MTIHLYLRISFSPVLFIPTSPRISIPSIYSESSIHTSAYMFPYLVYSIYVHSNVIYSCIHSCISRTSPCISPSYVHLNSICVYIYTSAFLPWISTSDASFLVGSITAESISGGAVSVSLLPGSLYICQLYLYVFQFCVICNCNGIIYVSICVICIYVLYISVPYHL